MNSKEALDEIIRSFNETTSGINGLGEVVVDNCLIRSNKAELEIIQKDLERLEKLEKAIKIIVYKQIVPYNFVKIKFEKEEELIKYYMLMFDLTEEEYKLLKEVLCNDNKS